MGVPRLKDGLFRRKELEGYLMKESRARRFSTVRNAANLRFFLGRGRNVEYPENGIICAKA